MKISIRQAILAAMAGITDSLFVTSVFNTGYVGKVTLGGYSIGKDMINASIAGIKRGRKEFVLQEGSEVDFIVSEIRSLPLEAEVIVNLRINEFETAKKFSKQLAQNFSSKPIIEINAHCQQPEFLEKGGGQMLLDRLTVLEKIIAVFKHHDFRISVKLRGNMVEPREFMKTVNKWEIDFFHIDSYRQGVLGTDLNLLKQYIMSWNGTIIGNNSVIDTKSAEAILNTGAEFFSVARAAQENVGIFKEIIKN